eukprot:918965-Heterocapsa_arctica.AAC.1
MSYQRVGLTALASRHLALQPLCYWACAQCALMATEFIPHGHKCYIQKGWQGMNDRDVRSI